MYEASKTHSLTTVYSANGKEGWAANDETRNPQSDSFFLKMRNDEKWISK